MSRKTVTLTAPNGAKVRTVRSKRYFVVQYGTVQSQWNPKTRLIEYFEPRPFAEVVKRTDSATTAWTELRKSASTRVVFEVVVVGGEVVVTDATAYVYDAAWTERAAR